MERQAGDLVETRTLSESLREQVWRGKNREGRGVYPGKDQYRGCRGSRGPRRESPILFMQHRGPREGDKTAPIGLEVRWLLMTNERFREPVPACGGIHSSKGAGRAVADSCFERFRCEVGHSSQDAVWWGQGSPFLTGSRAALLLLDQTWWNRVSETVVFDQQWR